MTPNLPKCSVVVLLAGLLAGCATGGQTQHEGAESAMSMNSGAGDAQMDMADMQAMCETHKKMMIDKTSAERKAMMDEKMKKMSPEMRKKMEMMHAQCQ